MTPTPRAGSPNRRGTGRIPLVTAVAVVALLTGCGSTVQLRNGVGTDAAGLSAGGNLSSGGTAGPAGAALPGAAGTSGTSGQTLSSAGSVGGAGLSAGAIGSAGSAGAAGVRPGPAAGTANAAPVTGPIQLGFMTTTVGNAQSLGINVGQTYSDQAMYDALVKDINAHGGLAGHKILPVYGSTDTASSDWNTQFQAACSNLTQDHKVRAVIGYVFVFLDGFEQCLARAGVPHLSGGYQPGDAQAQRDFPNLTSIAHPTVDTYDLITLSGAVTSGHLSSKSKLGVLIDTCAHGERAFAAAGAPYLKAQGIPYELTQLSCAGGSGDVGSAAAAVKSAELSFAAHGVTTVFASGVELLLFMENAESQSYRPQYLTGVGGAALEANAPAAQLANLHGFGWMPAVDTDPNHQPAPLRPAQRSCLAMLHDQGLNPQAYNDFMEAYVTCDGLALYGQALTRTGGRTDPAAIQQAVLAEMPSFQGAATYEGRLQSGPTERGGPASWREWDWAASCSCFTYRGATFAVPHG
ncbi:MAG: hypothetical protein NVSMB55_28460 [Mycobacteriales bacterium]